MRAVRAAAVCSAVFRGSRLFTVFVGCLRGVGRFCAEQSIDFKQIKKLIKKYRYRKSLNTIMAIFCVNKNWFSQVY